MYQYTQINLRIGIQLKNFQSWNLIPVAQNFYIKFNPTIAVLFYIHRVSRKQTRTSDFP